MLLGITPGVVSRQQLRRENRQLLHGERQRAPSNQSAGRKCCWRPKGQTAIARRMRTRMLAVLRRQRVGTPRSHVINDRSSPLRAVNTDEEFDRVMLETAWLLEGEQASAFCQALRPLTAGFAGGNAAVHVPRASLILRWMLLLVLVLGIMTSPLTASPTASDAARAALGVSRYPR